MYKSRRNICLYLFIHSYLRSHENNCLVGGQITYLGPFLGVLKIRDPQVSMGFNTEIVIQNLDDLGVSL